MTRCMLPHAQAASEFGAYNGDCVENAMLMSLHARWPWRWPLTMDQLNAITAQAIASYGAGSEGQWDQFLMAQFLADRGYSCTQDSLDGWPARLLRWGGQKPCVLGVTDAQMLPGNENGVHNHGVALLGVDDAGAFYCGNGDALNSDPSQIQVYTADQLTAAQLSSITWIEGPMLMPSDAIAQKYFRDQGGGTWARADNPTIVIRGGMADYYRTVFSPGDAAGLDVLGLPLGNEYNAGAAYQLNGSYVQPTYQDFERGRLLYDPAHKVDSTPGIAGPVFPTHVLPQPAAKDVGTVKAAAVQISAALTALNGWLSQ